MTTPAGHDRVADAHAWASGLIDLARTLVADGVEVDLSPIRPAVRELCDLVRALPKDEAAVWLDRLVALQSGLADLGRALAERERGAAGPQQPEPRS